MASKVLPSDCLWTDRRTSSWTETVDHLLAAIFLANSVEQVFDRSTGLVDADFE
jgi:hypothetical protein